MNLNLSGINVDSIRPHASFGNLTLDEYSFNLESVYLSLVLF